MTSRAVAIRAANWTTSNSPQRLLSAGSPPLPTTSAATLASSDVPVTRTCWPSAGDGPEAFGRPAPGRGCRAGMYDDCVGDQRRHVGHRQAQIARIGSNPVAPQQSAPAAYLVKIIRPVGTTDPSSQRMAVSDQMTSACRHKIIDAVRAAAMQIDCQIGSRVNPAQPAETVG